MPSPLPGRVLPARRHKVFLNSAREHEKVNPTRLRVQRNHPPILPSVNVDHACHAAYSRARHRRWGRVSTRANTPTSFLLRLTSSSEYIYVACSAQITGKTTSSFGDGVLGRRSCPTGWTLVTLIPEITPHVIYKKRASHKLPPNAKICVVLWHWFCIRNYEWL